MFTMLLYIGSAVFLIFSYFKDRKKTKLALKKALNAFLNILPDFAVVLALVAVLLTFVSPAIITRVLGEQAGAAGLFLASVVGSITLIPGFVAFPLAATLLQRGAGLATIAVFISTLMMVGVVTFPRGPGCLGGDGLVIRLVKLYKYCLIIIIFDPIILALNPPTGKQLFHFTYFNFAEMLKVLPPIFILLGLLDVWVPREKIIRYLGEKSGAVGIALSITH